MNTILNVALIIGFGYLGTMMFYRYFKTKDLLIIPEKTWNFIRAGFAVIIVFVIFSLLVVRNTIFDFIRIGIMLMACVGYMLVRDGLANDGVIHNGKLIPWQQIKAWDRCVTKKRVEVYFSIDESTEKKPDRMGGIELDFDLKNKDQVEHFMQVNARRKYTRMKKR